MKETSKPRILIPIHQIRQIPIWLIVFLLAVDVMISAVLPGTLTSYDAVHWVFQRSSGLVTLTLLVNMIRLVIFMLLITLFGPLSCWEIGLKDDDRLSRGASVVMTVWVAVQVLNVMAGVLTPFESIVDSRWMEESVLPIVGVVFGQLFGEAFFESVIYRGFLLVQVVKRLQKMKHPMFYGALLSQLIAVLLDIPGSSILELSTNEILRSLAVLFISGLIFAALYLLTDNLLLVIGFQTMMNAPTFFFNGDMTYPGIITAMVVVMLTWRHFTQAKVPMPLRELETERLILRPWQLTDAKDLFEYARSELVGPSAGWKPHPSLRMSRDVIRSFIDSGEVYAITLKSKNKVIGSVGIHEKYPDNSDRRPGQKEIGYVLNPAYWGNGYMPEAVEAVKEFCFGDLGIRKLWCGHFVDNHKSRRVIEKCGFSYRLIKETLLVGLDNKKVMTMFYCIDKAPDDTEDPEK